MSQNVEPRTLSQLAHFDGQVHQHRSAIAAGRKREADLRQLRIEYAAEAKEKKTRLEVLESANKGFEKEIEEVQRQVKQHSRRLDEIQDSREYRALNDEVRYLRRQIESKEESILANMELIERAGAEFKSANGDFESKVKEIAAEIERIEGERAASEQEMETAGKALEHYLGQVGEAAERWYRRRAGKMPRPVVWMAKDACGYCQARLTPQKQHEVASGKATSTCEFCGRIVVASLTQDTTVS